MRVTAPEHLIIEIFHHLRAGSAESVLRLDPRHVRVTRGDERVVLETEGVRIELPQALLARTLQS